MKSKSLFSLILLLILASSLPNLWAQEELFSSEYTCFDRAGNKRWDSAAKLSFLDEANHIYILTESGRGIFSGFKDKISWRSTLEFESRSDTIIPIKTVRYVYDESGKPQSVATQEFNFMTGEAIYKYEDLVTHKKHEKIFKFKGEIINKLSLALYVRKFLKNGERKKITFFLSDEPRLYKVNLKVIGEEAIQINGREIDTYKILLDPNLGILNLFKLFLPRAYMWNAMGPKFTWLKYRGPENGPLSIKIEIINTD